MQPVEDPDPRKSRRIWRPRQQAFHPFSTGPRGGNSHLLKLVGLGQPVKSKLFHRR